MIPPNVYLVGVLPDVEGRILEGFRIESLVQDGVVESRCHIAYWRMEGQWWRTFAEELALFILPWKQEPVSWDAGPELLSPVEEVAQECSGSALRRLTVSIVHGCPALQLVLEDGRAIECFSDEQGFTWNHAALRSPNGSVTLL